MKDPESGTSPDAVREHILLDANSAIRWFEHGYPHPLARWHHHPEIEIHLITASTGTSLIGDGAVAFKPGDLFLVGSHLPHNWISAIPPGAVVERRDALVQFAPELLQRLSAEVLDLSAADRLLGQARLGTMYLDDAAREGGRALLSMRDTTGIDRFSRFLSLLNVLLAAPAENRLSISRAPAGSPLPSAESERVAEAIAFVQANLHGPLRLSDVADHIGLSTSSTSRLFTRATGGGFARTVTRLRLSEARQLLRTTDMQIADICWQVGYTNLSHFNRQFRQEAGSSPREYRAMTARRVSSGDLEVL